MPGKDRSLCYTDRYVPEPLVDENVFLNMKPDRSYPRNFPESRAALPEPFWEGHESAIECYWKAWDLAFRNCKRVLRGNGFIAPYIDTAFNDCIFMWDSSFILMFAKYGRRAFEFQRTLDNFYAVQHPDGFITRELQEWNGNDRFHRYDPVSTGPNLMPWCEWEYFLNFGDKDRLAKIFPPLLAYYHWTRHHRTWPDGSYWSSGWGCGMDNQPRIPGAVNPQFVHGHMAWIDATAQAVLAGKMLVRMAKVLGRAKDTRDIVAEMKTLAAYMNARMWREDTKFYSDRFRDGKVSSVKSIAAYWTLLAGVVPPKRLKPFVAHLCDRKTFNRPHRVPTLSADNPEYKATGGYWQGGVWPPTNYMILRGLTETGFDDLAADVARNHYDNVLKVFERTGTFWENYAPEKAAPGKPAMHDFVGWSGLGPISIFFEYVLGLRPSVPDKRIVWDIRLTEAHGVSRYPFGPTGTLDLRCERRKRPTEEPRITVHGNVDVKVDLRWHGGRKLVKCSRL